MEDDLGAVDEAAESQSDAEPARADPKGDPDAPVRESRPVAKEAPGASVELSQTFQSEVHAHQAVPAVPSTSRTTTKGRSVELSRTFQSEVAQLNKPRPRIPPPKIPSRPIPPPKKATREVARAERLARRLRDRKSSGAIKAVMQAPAAGAARPTTPAPAPPTPSRPAPLPVPSRNATLEGMSPLAPSARRVEQSSSARKTLDGAPPDLAAAVAAAAEARQTERPPPPDAGTTPSLDSPPAPALEPTPTRTASPQRSQTPTLTREDARATDPPSGIPAFASEMLESSAERPIPDTSDEVDLSATFRSETVAFESEPPEASEDGPVLTVERRASTDNEAGRGFDEDEDPFGDLSTGTEIGGRYRLERIIGRGATGVVFEASHLVIGKHVALKCLYPHYLETPNAVERFFREARIAATLEHPNVVQVFDGGRSGETMFLAMERLVGETLGDRLERGPLPIPDAVDVFLKVASALAAVHERGVVHRDLKPDNIFLPEPKGDRPVEPKVLDFGVSKLKEPGRKELTSLGTVLGTPYYMSPEQIRNTRDVDATADVYSLGVMLYETLSGELPYDGDSVVDIFEAARRGARTPLEELCPNLPDGLSQIVDKAMSAERSDRYPTAREMHEAVEAIALAGTDPSRDPPTDPKQRMDSGITPSPLSSRKPDSVPDQDIVAIAQRSDQLLKPRREMATVELPNRTPIPAPPAPAPSTAESFPEDETGVITRPRKRSRAWVWIVAILAVLVIGAVITLAGLELLGPVLLGLE